MRFLSFRYTHCMGSVSAPQAFDSPRSDLDSVMRSTSTASTERYLEMRRLGAHHSSLVPFRIIVLHLREVKRDDRFMVYVLFRLKQLHLY